MRGKQKSQLGVCCNRVFLQSHLFMSCHRVFLPSQLHVSCQHSCLQSRLYVFCRHQFSAVASTCVATIIFCESQLCQVASTVFLQSHQHFRQWLLYMSCHPSFRAIAPQCSTVAAVCPTVLSNGCCMCGATLAIWSAKVPVATNLQLVCIDDGPEAF